MKVTILGSGTSQGVPVIACKCDICLSENPKDKRLRSSILIQTADEAFVIDAGPDFRTQMLTNNVDWLDAVLFTHQHKDHTAGLDDVRAYNFVSQQDMPIYGKKDVLEQIKQEYAYIFATVKYPGVPSVEPITIENKPFSLKSGLEILPIEVFHHKLPVFGFRVNNFVYITDANYIAEQELEKMKNADYLVINALRHEKHISHFNLAEALEIIEICKPKKHAYLTHISHRLGKYDQISQQLPKNVSLAYDGLQIIC